MQCGNPTGPRRWDPPTRRARWRASSSAGGAAGGRKRSCGALHEPRGDVPVEVVELHPPLCAGAWPSAPALHRTHANARTLACPTTPDAPIVRPASYGETRSSIRQRREQARADRRLEQPRDVPVGSSKPSWLPARVRVRACAGAVCGCVCAGRRTQELRPFHRLDRPCT